MILKSNIQNIKQESSKKKKEIYIFLIFWSKATCILKRKEIKNDFRIDFYFISFFDNDYFFQFFYVKKRRNYYYYYIKN